jgi:hypothetical protein
VLRQKAFRREKDQRHPDYAKTDETVMVKRLFKNQHAQR